MLKCASHETHGLWGVSPSTLLLSRLRASSICESHWFKPSTTPRSCKSVSNSRWHPSSSLVLSCFHTPSKALGQCPAGVGKHALKLAYEFAFNVEVRAVVKILCNAAALSPGVEATGAWGGGEGETDVREGILRNFTDFLVESNEIRVAVHKKLRRSQVQVVCLHRSR